MTVTANPHAYKSCVPSRLPREQPGTELSQRDDRSRRTGKRPVGEGALGPGDPASPCGQDVCGTQLSRTLSKSVVWAWKRLSFSLPSAFQTELWGLWKDVETAGPDAEFQVSLLLVKSAHRQRSRPTRPSPFGLSV